MDMIVSLEPSMHRSSGCHRLRIILLSRCMLSEQEDGGWLSVRYNNLGALIPWGMGVSFPHNNKNL